MFIVIVIGVCVYMQTLARTRTGTHTHTHTQLTILVGCSSQRAADLDVSDLGSGFGVGGEAVGLQVGGGRVPVQCVPQPHISRGVPGAPTNTGHTESGKSMVISIMDTDAGQCLLSPPRSLVLQ